MSEREADETKYGVLAYELQGKQWKNGERLIVILQSGQADGVVSHQSNVMRGFPVPPIPPLPEPIDPELREGLETVAGLASPHLSHLKWVR